MSEQAVRRCPACGLDHHEAPQAPAGMPTMHVCPRCGTFVVVRIRNLGEALRPGDVADPDEWGRLG